MLHASLHTYTNKINIREGQGELKGERERERERGVEGRQMDVRSATCLPTYIHKPDKYKRGARRVEGGGIEGRQMGGTCPLTYTNKQTMTNNYKK